MLRPWRAKWLVLALAAIAWADAGARAGVTTKPLGDINRDGKKEVAVVETDRGVSGTRIVVRIKSGDRVVLALPPFNNWATVDDYRLLGDRIAAWYGDMASMKSKWDPFYYDFIWYQWSARKRCYVQFREGFTKKAYGYAAAQKTMPNLAKDPGKEIVLSQKPTFLQDARDQAVRKYGQRAARVGIEEQKFDASTFHPPMARYYMVHLDVGGLEYPFISLYRDGTWKAW